MRQPGSPAPAVAAVGPAGLARSPAIERSTPSFDVRDKSGEVVRTVTGVLPRAVGAAAGGSTRTQPPSAESVSDDAVCALVHEELGGGARRDGAAVLVFCGTKAGCERLAGVVARHRAAVPDLDGSVVPGRHSTAQAIMDARRELLARLQEVQQQAPP